MISKESKLAKKSHRKRTGQTHARATRESNSSQALMS